MHLYAVLLWDGTAVSVKAQCDIVVEVPLQCHLHTAYVCRVQQASVFQCAN